ncbi:ABC transporter ATP-binding protein [Nocardioides sp.]|uniref:ABC transporter ATP-binding protein n=1 Tax=Nocardioides sp. TaxID=35761 RepID=UPI0039E23399
MSQEMGQETSPEPLLSIRDLVVEFDTPRGRLRAVDQVSLDVAAGERLGIVGESGSGKSVLCRTAMGLLGAKEARVSGEVRYRGRSVLDMSARQRRQLWGREVAMVFQDPLSSLHPITPIGRQVAEAVRRDGTTSRAQARRRAVELLDMVGIPQAERRARARAHELSGGMRQRVVIAIAMAAGPDLLFADEPTTALDVTVQARILELFDELCREFSIGLVMVSHDLGVVAEHTDAVTVMYGGRIAEQGSVGEVIGRPTMRYTRALLDAIPRLDARARQLPRPIGGLPPMLIDPAPGCRFSPRCGAALDRCRAEAPPLESRPGEIGQGVDHRYACWNPVEEVAR